MVQVFKASVGDQVVAVKLPKDIESWRDLDELQKEGSFLAQVADCPQTINVLGYVVPEGKDFAHEWKHHGIVLEYFETSIWDMMEQKRDEFRLCSAQM